MFVEKINSKSSDFLAYQSLLLFVAHLYSGYGLASLQVLVAFWSQSRYSFPVICRNRMSSNVKLNLDKTEFIVPFQIMYQAYIHSST